MKASKRGNYIPINELFGLKKSEAKVLRSLPIFLLIFLSLFIV